MKRIGRQPSAARCGLRKGIILITGASSGLGEQMARQFAELGYDLALCARRSDRLDTLAQNIRSATGRRVETAALDVTDAHAVSSAFGALAHRLGPIDRIIVNAGVGSGAALGIGQPEKNMATAMTNFVGALNQIESAMEIFRSNGRGHLVLISSISALRGMRKSLTTYAATKAAVASLAEGLRAENLKGIDVSVIYPGYIRSEMNAHVQHKTRFMVDTPTGVRAMVKAIEQRRVKAYVPAWPWLPLGIAIRTLPLGIVRRIV